MYKWERTFSQWLLYLLAAIMLTACGSGDGDSVLPVTGTSNYQLSVSSTATSIGASGSATVTATLLSPTGIPVVGANIAFARSWMQALCPATLPQPMRRCCYGCHSEWHRRDGRQRHYRGVLLRPRK
jgi:hypothetical protein